jgi:N-methylhydantoinase A
LRDLDLAALEQAWQELAEEAGRQLAADGFEAGAIRIQRLASLHYQGQTFDLTVAVDAGPLDHAAIVSLEEAFGREHERTYGHRAGPEEPVELTEIRLIGQGIPERPLSPQTLQLAEPGDGQALPSRAAYFGPETGWLETPILRRGDLTTPREGPCIVEEYDATTVVPSGARALLDARGNIVIAL